MGNKIPLTVIPENALLKKYISQYYFHQQDAEAPSVRFNYYPHTHNGLTIYKNSQVKFEKGYSKSTPNDAVDYFYCFTANGNFGTVQIDSPFNKIGVIFKPLGLNHFMDRPLMEVMDSPGNGTFAFYEGRMEATLDQVFDTPMMEKKIRLLDAFFLTQYREFKYPQLIQAIDLITASRQRIKISDICEQVQIHPRTLLRLFKLHMGCTTKTYISADQFRKTLLEYAATEEISFTELSYNLNYYDQAEFNKHIKKLTRSIPKKFFKELVQTDSVFWSYKE